MIKIKILFLLIMATLFQSCSDNDNDSSNNTCNLLYVIDAATGLFTPANGYSLQTMENRIHRLNIKSKIGGTICGISYQNAPGYTGDYEFKIYVDGQVRYQGNLSFSQTDFQEKPIPNIPFNANQTIEIIRTCYSGNTNDWIGKVYRKTDFSDITYPLSHGNIIYNNGMTYDDPAIFENNGPLNNVVPLLLLTYKSL